MPKPKVYDKCPWVHTDTNKPLNKFINRKEEIDLPHRVSPNNLCKYSTLKKGENNAPLRKCGLSIVTSEEYAGGRGRGVGRRVTLEWRNLTKSTSTRWSSFTLTARSHVDSIYFWYDETGTLPLWSSFQKSILKSNTQKNIKFQWRSSYIISDQDASK